MPLLVVAARSNSEELVLVIVVVVGHAESYPRELISKISGKNELQKSCTFDHSNVAFCGHEFAWFMRSFMPALQNKLHQII